MYINKVMIMGNLCKDPELKALPSGTKVVNFSIATNRVWYNDKKEKQEAVEYHNIVAFGKQAETIDQYVKKGDSLLVEGRLQTRSWETDGVKKYATEIIMEKFQFGQKKNNAPKEAQKPQDLGKAGNTDIDYPDEDINPDEIPF